SNRYLALSLGGYPAPTQVEALDPQTGEVFRTSYAIDFGSEPAVGSTAHIFFGWLDDTTFLGAIAPLVNGANTVAPRPSRLVRVDLQSGKETTIGTIPRWGRFCTFSAGDNERI